MANCYDIDIQLDYFLSGDSYEDMLKNKKEWDKQVKIHNDYFKKISTKEKYKKVWNEIYKE
tara:strand:+ start:726 stop:908 length:183 start_codon:yes stop_codon:yes gene_type:complete